MRVLFDGLVPVAYSQAYVTSFEAPDMTAAFAGQVSGLCGAVEAESRVQEKHLRRCKERRHNDDLRSWGGRLPSDRLRALGNSVRGFAREDRDLVDAVVEAGEDTQRQIAIWAARSALTAGGIVDLD